MPGTDLEELLRIWNPDAFRLRWQVKHEAYVRARHPASVGSSYTFFGATIEWMGVPVPRRLGYIWSESGRGTVIHAQSRRVLYRGDWANVEILLGVYLWWLGRRGTTADST